MFECLQRGDAVRDHRKRKRKRKRKEVEEKPVRFCSDSDNHFISLRGSTVSLLLIQTRKHQEKNKQKNPRNTQENNLTSAADWTTSKG